MIFDDLVAALEGLGVDGESYVLRMSDEINDSDTFIKSYNPVTSVKNGCRVESSDKSLIPVTWDQVVAKNNEIQSANAYKISREQSYPSIPDQLDEIYHSGIDAWKTKIKAVKDKFPKPS